MTGLFCGVDEAGRGPVIGPMALAAAVFDGGGLNKLRQLNVRDSKKISLGRRRHLEPLIKDLAVEWSVALVSPADIDRLRRSMSLNQIEAEKTAEMLKSLSTDPSRIVVDSCDSNSDAYALRITSILQGDNADFVLPEFISEHKADDRYAECSAASVLAKVERDRQVDALKEEYGDFGSGYPSDEATQRWLRENREGGFPPIVRMSWNTVAKSQQASLGDF